MNTYTLQYIHTSTHTHIHTYIHIHTHTYTHTHKYTYTHTNIEHIHHRTHSKQSMSFFCAYRIATSGTRGSAEFVTRFWGRSGAFWRQELEALTPREVEPKHVRELVPNGCFVNVTFAIEAYKFEETRGLRHVARSITVHSS